eukprot:SM000349S12881  [mRNA]  locus=s349:77780:80799:- [translate_table: standard]
MAAEGRDPGPPPLPDESAAAAAAAAAEGEGEFPLGRPPVLGPDMPFNPFQNNSYSITGVYEVLRTAVVLPLFLIRVLLLLLMLLMGYLSTKVALVGARDTLTRPFSPWRRASLWPVRLCARGLLFACGYHWIRVKGKPAPRDAAPILVSNHVTFVDPVFVFFAHLPVIVTAKENLEIPIAGAIMHALQVIAVDRSSPSSRKDAAGEIKRRAMCNDWANIMLFPEATTTNGRSLVSFKTGAFAPGLPIQPIVIKYPHDRCDPSWVVEGPPIHLLLFKLMTQFYNMMVVEYLPVMVPSKRDRHDPHFFADRCRSSMARALNVNVTEHTYGDVALALEAEKMRVPLGVANVEFGRMERLFHLDVKEAKYYLKKFNAMDVTRSGQLTLDEFLKALEVPDTPATRKAFYLFDSSEKGYINFREFVAGLAFISKHTKFKESIEAAFCLCDADNDGVLSHAEAEASLRILFPSIQDSQVRNIYEALDLDKNGSISWTDFSEFLQRNPEYLALILTARPKLLSLHSADSLSKHDGLARYDSIDFQHPSAPFQHE